MKNIRKKQGGITLIALVVTIIVLLILAGIAISMLAGNNGILNKAAEAKVNTDNSTTEEMVKLAAMGAITNKDHKIANQSSLEAQLNEQGLSGYTLTAGTDEYTLEVDGLKYSIGTNGSVAEVVPSTKQWEITTDSGDTGLSVGDLLAPTAEILHNERFYVISVGTDDVTLLAERNVDTSSSVNAQADGTYPVKFDDDSYVYYSSTHSSYIKGLVDAYVEKLANNGLTLEEVDSNGLFGRLLLCEDMTAQGWAANGYQYTSEAPGFLRSPYFWYDIPHSGAYTYVGSDLFQTDMEEASVDTSDYYGVRPVIKILKSNV